MICMKEFKIIPYNLHMLLNQKNCQSWRRVYSSIRLFLLRNHGQLSCVCITSRHFEAIVPAERTGNRNLHIIAIEQMLTLFAATGHLNYAKSSRLYLRLMQELPTDYPWLYHCFTEQRFHTVHRSSLRQNL